MRKKLLAIWMGMIGGIVFFSGHAPINMDASQTYAATESKKTQTSDTMDEIEDLVANGEFDSSSLTTKQISAITSAYDQDPQAIRELQKKSDANKENSASLYSINTSLYTHDSQFDGYDVINGIDISRWQGNIDWAKVKASGVQFALIRVALRTTESGVLEADALYKENLEGAIAAGIDVGVYVYSQAITTAEAKAEADYTMKLIKGYNITLPVVMDFEYYTNNSGRLARANLSVTEATKICNAFCAEVEGQNYTAMVYANKSLLTNDVNASSIAKNYQIWLAQYPGWDSATNSIHASYEGKYSYWQYTSSGSVDGISGNVDMNFRYVKKPGTVKNLRSSAVSMQKVTFKWDKVPYVYGYRIYRYNKETKSYLLVGSTVGAGSTSFTDKNLAVKTLYSYKVRAYYKVNYSKYYGGYSNVINISTQKKTVEDLEVDDRSRSSISLSWTPQTEVSGYQIVRYNSAAGKYKTVGYVKDAEINTYCDEGLTCGTTYSYKVRAYYEEDGHRAYFDYSNAIKANTKPGTVTGLSASSTQNSVTLKWNAQVNVSGYYVYVLNSSSKWERIATIKSKSTAAYTHKKLKGTTKYKYTVVAYYKKSGKTVRTDRADAITVMTKPASVKNLEITSAKKDAITLSWKKAKNVSGYLVYYKKNTSGSSWKRIATLPSGTTSWKQEGLKSNTKYKFKVKAYYKNDGVTTTSTATVISVKTAPKQVTGVTIKSYGSKQLLTWDAQTAADGFIIYRYDKKKKTYTRVAALSSAASSYVINAKASSKYKYCISAYNKVSGKTYKGTRSDFAAKKSGAHTATVLCSALNIRKGAGTKYNVITTVSKGTTLNITGVASGWYKVSFRKNGVNYSGYASSSYIRIK